MSRPADRSTREPRRAHLGRRADRADPGRLRRHVRSALSHAVSGAARASRAATRLSQQLMRSWCPQAVAAAAAG